MKYFTIEELLHSDIAYREGIDNTPTDVVVANLQRLVDVVLDPARERLGLPIRVTSGYRCAKLNKRVGGAARSHHMEGRAADLTMGSVTSNRRLLAALKELPHCELIWEKGGRWVHVAL
jgi:uncharacterized protein YcbK (DUF882 family)